MDTLEQRAKRVLETPLGARVMLPTFGSKLFELIDTPIDDEYKLKFIAYTHEAFYDTQNQKLWDADLEPKQVLFDAVGNNEIEATLIFTTGEELTYGN